MIFLVVRYVSIDIDIPDVNISSCILKKGFLYRLGGVWWVERT